MAGKCLGNILLKLRQRLGLSREELATEMGISREAVRRAECGILAPSGKMLARYVIAANASGQMLTIEECKEFAHLARRCSTRKNTPVKEIKLSAMQEKIEKLQEKLEEKV